MAKKAKAPKQGGVMEQLAAYSPPWEDDPADKVQTKEDDTKPLLERISKLESEIEATRRQNAYNSFQSGAVAAAAGGKVEPAVTRTVVDFKTLPDPVNETDKYHAELERRMNAALDAREQGIRAEQAAQAEQERLGTRLWEGFKTAHPGWEDHQMLVGAAAAQVNQALLGRNVDVVAMMQRQPELFYKEVADVLDKNYGKLKKGSETDAEEDEEDEPAQVFGGAPGKGGGVLTDVAASIEDENKAWLRELGEARAKARLR